MSLLDSVTDGLTSLCVTVRYDSQRLMYGKKRDSELRDTVKDQYRYILRAKAERMSYWNVKKEKNCEVDRNADKVVTNDRRQWKEGGES